VLSFGEKRRKGARRASPKPKVYSIGLAFADQGAIECMVGFRIDRHTIKVGFL
jgi:hypothetical protein